MTFSLSMKFILNEKEVINLVDTKKDFELIRLFSGCPTAGTDNAFFLNESD